MSSSRAAPHSAAAPAQHADAPPLPCAHASWPVVRERLQHLADLGLGRDGAEQGAICSGAALVAELDELRRALGLGHLGVAGTLLAAHLDMAGAPRAGWLASTLPYVLRLAARLPDALAAAPPLRVLRAGQVGTASVSRAAAASLLAAAFLCLTPPKRAAAVFPHFTLQHVFEDLRWPSQKAKVDCFMYYFSRVASAPPPGRLLFTRMLLSAPPQEADWAASKAPLLALRFHAIGSLTDSAAPLKADFANEYLGGGAMGHGCVQEEILFVTWPELCVGALLCEKMRADEALLLRGAQRFSAHAGYHYGFLWAGGFEGAALADLTPDAEGVLPSTFVAFDALRRPGKPQFTPELMIREANKALVAFGGAANGATRGAVATGNWGCGAFGGDFALKALLQWCAASEAGREVHYYAYDDANAAPLETMPGRLLGAGIRTVGELFQLLRRYKAERQSLGMWDWLALQYPQ